MTKSFKEYEHEGWNDKASQYERFNLPLSRQGFEPILTSFGDLRGKKLLDVCTGPVTWQARLRRTVRQWTQSTFPKRWLEKPRLASRM